MRTAQEILSDYNPECSAYIHEDDAIGAMEEYATDLKTENILLSAENEQLKGHVQMLIETINNQNVKI